jgi:PKD repeat protein
MSVVGALSPDALFAGTNAGSDGAKLAANTAEETLSTLRLSDGQAFARVSILWAEVDGRRVSEDAWGTGEVGEIRFKVGVKDIEGSALAVGEKIVDLNPTDIITVRMFRGDFSYRGIGTPTATVQLQGSVKTTVLNEGALPNRVLTQVSELELSRAATQPRDERVAYVVLTTGERVDTVAVEDGGSRLFTQEAAVATEAKQEPGNLLAKWVKIDGKLVREYTWGDGTIGKIEFEPAESVSRSVVLTFNGEVSEVAAGERVVVEDYVGEYLAYQVSGGLLRLRLDGYAAVYKLGGALPLPQSGGDGAPLATFDFSPISPRTSDSVLFRDASEDEDGQIVFRRWDFGDNTSAIQREATHRFSKPGMYDVTLTITDNDLKSSSITQTIVVRNAAPIADFDFSPKVVTTDTIVAFNDHSYDSDGGLVNWTWDFGDGVLNHSRHPTHRFSTGGDATVTLTVTDDLGSRTSLSKVVLVRNSPPLAGFTYAPAEAATLDPIQFFDNSSDSDGDVVSWNWSFGDGRHGAGSSPVHAYARPGLYIVTLTATDNGGDSDTASTTIFVANRAPFAEFEWAPLAQPASVPITFTSRSTDPDGTVLSARWSWGDGSRDSSGLTVTHVFPRAGVFDVTLTVTDNTLGVSNVTRSVTVANSAPRANMHLSPNPTFRETEITFSDVSTDPDGDAIASAHWDFGDGNSSAGSVVRHAYDDVGEYDVRLTVTDDQDQTSTLTRTLRILNRPPVISLGISNINPRAGENVTFDASGSDPDSPESPLQYDWLFSDGETATGASVTRSFPERGDYSVQVRGTDSEGAVSSPVVRSMSVDYARPHVAFDWSPLIPAPNQLVTFNDRSTSPNGPIRDWSWSFGDGGPDSSSNRPSPTYAYRANGTFLVRLTVTDVLDQSATTERVIVINNAPVATFTAPSGSIPLNTPIAFTDTSLDVDGYVTNWSWTFGDGYASFERHPTHPGFQSPGSFIARLAVRDNEDATNSTTRLLNVMNTAPLARWSHDSLSLPQAVNNTIQFRGYDLSYDPDGTPLTSYTWDFGDGTASVSGANTTHAYPRSGKYTVGLTVSDGMRASERTADSHKLVRIAPANAVTLAVSASLPDGSSAAINTPPYAVSVRIGSTHVDGGAFAPVGNGYDIALDPALWVHGDVAMIRVNAPFLAGVNEQQVVLRDGTLTLPVHFQLRMAVRPTITPAPGERVSPVAAILGGDTYYGPDPLYHDMTEAPHGTGRLLYADGAPAAGMTVDIETRWVPIRFAAFLRNATDDRDTITAAPNWCRAGTATTALDGTFEWRFEKPSVCLPNAGLEIYPMGRWDVRARPQVATAENRVSEIRAFYVDPTGGALLRSTFGLA